jgi:hypothetical protein
MALQEPRQLSVCVIPLYRYGTIRLRVLNAQTKDARKLKSPAFRKWSSPEFR